MRKFIGDNSLSLALFGLFAMSLIGQYFAGWHEYNEDQIAHAQQSVTAIEYISEGHFWSALFENWESEFLQMAVFIIFTIFLHQKGGAESKEKNTIDRVDVVPGKEFLNADAPWPVKRGGWVLKLYENSLSITLLILFVGSFFGHAIAGARNYNNEQLPHGGQTVTTLEYIETSRFWFESFQNWQSEFLSIGVLIFLTIYLRQKGSPESKPVDSPHSETGH